MIYFNNTPDSLGDDSLEAGIRKTLDQMIKARTQLIARISGELDHAKRTISNMQARVDWLPGTSSPNFNSLGEFQQCLSHQADLFISQYTVVDEVIRQLEFLLADHSEEEDNVEERTTHSELCIPERPAERKPAKRTGKSQGARASDTRKESGSRRAKQGKEGGTGRGTARKR